MSENYYDYKSEILNAVYNEFNVELGYQIKQAGNALLQAADKPSYQIDPEEDSLFVGAFESLINGFPRLESILMEPGRVLLRLDLFDGFYPLEDFDTLTTYDKLSILELIENQIEKLL
jgi:hypothetical protein